MFYPHCIDVGCRSQEVKPTLPEFLRLVTKKVGI